MEMKQKALAFIQMTAKCQLQLGKQQQGQREVGRSEKYLEGGTNRIQLCLDMKNKGKREVKGDFQVSPLNNQMIPFNEIGNNKG